ncbi:hypothetical protein ED733_006409 [Metarhizium rileyi]|uniref:Heat shock protein Hsp70 n=1 Tax=Metarhizium rileyi (strain RCEF 4871) TaxID=1649241 RepID=A0A5C6GG41_METRR|nr:hypothetical protein ED733_006409 [Metarhizium rileyi]
MECPHSIIVAIDFGTTYSGVAYARGAEPNHVHFVSNWSSQDLFCFTKQKVPTVIYYSPDESSPKWGYEVDPGQKDALRWFKLLLLDDDHVPDHLKRSKYITTAKSLLKKVNKHVTDVIADYLRLLWKHSLRSIERTIGENMVRLSAFKVVVTLPAIWPLYAQIRMHKAILAAGLLDKRAAGESVLTFLPEPEAAAYAIFHKMYQRPDMKRNDGFVVCDAGGGTVDIITYNISRLQPLSFRESVPGDDEAFEHLLNMKLPREVLAALSRRDRSSIISDNWENGIKVGFTNSEKPWTISKANENGKAPKYVLLVGGFGRSCVLYDYLKQIIRVRYRNVTILQDEGTDPWTAICKGAVINCLRRQQSLYSARPGLVDSRFSRASIGTLFNTLFDDDIHDIIDKEWSSLECTNQAVDQIHWFIHKGEVINGNEPTVFEYYQAFTQQPEEVTVDIVYSLEEFPPNRFDNSIRTLCRMRWSHIPKVSELQRQINDKGELFYELSYRIEMVTQGVSQDLQIFYNDKIVAAYNVREFPQLGREAEDDQRRSTLHRNVSV